MPNERLFKVYNPETRELRDATYDQAVRLKAAGFKTGEDAERAFYTDGPAGLITAAVTGGAGGASLGATDVLKEYLPDSVKQFINASEDAHSYVHGAAELGGGLFGLGKLGAVGKAAGLGTKALVASNVAASAIQGGLEAWSNDARQNSGFNIEHLASGAGYGSLWGIGGEAAGYGLVKLHTPFQKGLNALSDFAKDHGLIKVSKRATEARITQALASEARLADQAAFTGAGPMAPASPLNVPADADEIAFAAGHSSRMRDLKRAADPTFDPLPVEPTKPIKAALPEDAIGTPGAYAAPTSEEAAQWLAQGPTGSARPLPNLDEGIAARQEQIYKDAPLSTATAKVSPDDLFAGMRDFPQNGTRKAKYNWWQARNAEMQVSPEFRRSEALDVNEVARRNTVRGLDAEAFSGTEEGRVNADLNRLRAAGADYTPEDLGVDNWRNTEAIPHFADTLDAHEHALFTGTNPFSKEAIAARKAGDKEIVEGAKEFDRMMQNMSGAESDVVAEQAGKRNGFAEFLASGDATSVDMARSEQKRILAAERELQRTERVAAKAKNTADYKDAKAAYIEARKAYRSAVSQAAKTDKASFAEAAAKLKEETASTNRLNDFYAQGEQEAKRNATLGQVGAVYTPGDSGRIGDVLGTLALTGAAGYGLSSAAEKAGYDDAARTIKYGATFLSGLQATRYRYGLGRKLLADLASVDVARNARFENKLAPFMSKAGEHLNTFLRAGGAVKLAQPMSNREIDRAYAAISDGAQRLSDNPQAIDEHYRTRMGSLTQDNPQMHGQLVTKAGQVVQAVKATIPQSPLPPSALNPPYDPPRSAKLRTVQMYQALNNPVQTLLTNPTPEQQAAITQNYPEISKDLNEQLLTAVQDGTIKKWPRAKQAQLSRLMGGPMRPSDNAQYIARAQAAIAANNAQQAGSGGQGSPGVRPLSSTVAKNSAKLVAPGTQQNQLEDAL